MAAALDLTNGAGTPAAAAAAAAKKPKAKGPGAKNVFVDATQEQLRSYVQGTGLNLKDLESELATTRKRGYSTSHNELISGAVAVAVPFFDRDAKVAGSLGVFGPEVRLGAAQLKQIVNLLQDESVKLSEALGFGAAPKRR